MLKLRNRLNIIYSFKSLQVIKHIPKLFTTSTSTSSDNKMKIYTKSGDKGNTSLIGGKRLSKTEQIFNLLGDIDELSSYLGIVYYNYITKVLQFDKRKR